MKVLLFTLLLVAFQYAFGQATGGRGQDGQVPAGRASGGRISGKLTTAGGQSVPLANVLLLRTPDSVYVKAALTDEPGCFQVRGTGPGKYTIRCSSAGYQTHVVQ